MLLEILNHSANRWANVVVGAFHTLFVAWSLLGETPTLFYAFFVAVEVACSLFIVWYAWTWRRTEVRLNTEPESRVTGGVIQ